MNWEDLRHFLALARTGSLSRAAQDLGVDHTTVARHIKALEAALGVRLVDRLPRAIALTAEGRRIAQLGGGLDDGVQAILRAAQAFDPALSGEVCVSAPPLTAARLIAPQLPRLRARHPGITLVLIGDMAAADLTRREADIALRLSRPDDPSLVVRKLGEQALGLYAALDYDAPEAEWVFVAYEDLHISFPQQRWLDTFIGGRRVAFRSNDVTILTAAVEAGLGIGLLPVYAAAANPRMRRMPCDRAAPVRDLWMLVHDDLRRAPRVRAVMDFLAETLTGALPGRAQAFYAPR